MLSVRRAPAFTRTAVIVGGGNIDVTLLSRIIERGLVQDGRLIRLRIHLLDRPGALADLTQIIAAHRANIVDTLHNRAYYGVNLGDTVIDITMETRGREQVEELLAALTHDSSYSDHRSLPLWRMLNILRARTLHVQKSGSFVERLLYRIWLLRHSRNLRESYKDPRAWRETALQAFRFKAAKDKRLLT